MPQNNDSASKSKPTSIKIAAKESSQRSSAGGPADPGPGDPSAAPSVAPQLVDIPDPPTASQLVVKSATSRGGSGPNLPTLKEVRSVTGGGSGGPGSGYKSTIASSRHSSKPASHSMQGSQLGPAASNPSVGAPKEPTSSRPLTGPVGSKALDSNTASVSGGGTGANVGSISSMGAVKSAPAPSGGSPKSQTGSPSTASKAMQAESGMGVVHDEDEEGEGEIHHPVDQEGGGPSGPASPTPGGGLRGSSAVNQPSQASSPMAAASSKKTLTGSKSAMGGVSSARDEASAAQVGESSNAASAKGASTSAGLGLSDLDTSGGGKTSPALSMTKTSSGGGKDDKKKVTRFRYHKRITVRTSGKTSPSTIMHKVNKKDHNAGITPSTIEDLDPQELMKRAGIKGNKQTHWRVRLRQTKRLTKDGKTTTQTKVAYRDSEGNKRVKTSLTPYCKKCNKKLEDCKCDSNSQA